MDSEVYPLDNNNDWNEDPNSPKEVFELPADPAYYKVLKDDPQLYNHMAYMDEETSCVRLQRQQDLNGNGVLDADEWVTVVEYHPSLYPALMATGESDDDNLDTVNNTV